MSRLRLRISMSLDGFVAGPSQSVNNPLGIGVTVVMQRRGDKLAHRPVSQLANAKATRDSAGFRGTPSIDLIARVVEQ